MLMTVLSGLRKTVVVMAIIAPLLAAGDILLAQDEAPLRVGGDVTSPRKVSGAPPVYPDIARRAGIQGIVIIETIIDADGNVTNLSVLKGEPLLNQAAVDAVATWKFRPATLQGRPVKVRYTLTVDFRL
jgi:protein TonB